MLRAPGVLGLLGNSFDTSLPWAADLREILGPPAIERPGHWPPAETLRERFAEVEDRRFPHAQLRRPLAACATSRCRAARWRSRIRARAS